MKWRKEGRKEGRRYLFIWQKSPSFSHSLGAKKEGKKRKRKENFVLVSHIPPPPPSPFFSIYFLLFFLLLPLHFFWWGERGGGRGKEKVSKQAITRGAVRPYNVIVCLLLPFLSSFPPKAFPSPPTQHTWAPLKWWWGSLLRFLIFRGLNGHFFVCLSEQPNQYWRP